MAGGRGACIMGLNDVLYACDTIGVLDCQLSEDSINLLTLRHYDYLSSHSRTFNF